ncbi:hypothetical protein [Streptomyces sp. NPDC001678]|uniref:hypothetical protein n=1 Tax=Streptomyces sp. NPDC001678 TaxID=3364599 RepID=UPI00367D7E26
MEVAAYVVAPGSLLAGLLYYMGRSYTNAYYAFFGIPVGDLQLSSQSYVSASPAAVFLPLWFLLCCGLFVALVQGPVLSFLARPQARRLRCRLRLVLAGAGGVVVLLGFAVFIDPAWLNSAMSRISSPRIRAVLPSLVVATGTALSFFAFQLYRVDGSRAIRRVGRAIRGFLLALLAMSLFFGAARFADQAGSTQADRAAADGFRGSGNIHVLIDSSSPIHHDAPGISFYDLGPKYAPFRYQYRGFVLLAKTASHYYLASRVRRGSDNRDLTVVLPDDNTIRVELLSVADGQSMEMR